MSDWSAGALWKFFQANGIDPAVMQPYPMHGPMPLSAAQLAWQVEKAANRLAKTVAQAESGHLQPRAGQEKQVWATVARAKALLRYK
jgi:hypothetical protein